MSKHTHTHLSPQARLYGSLPCGKVIDTCTVVVPIPCSVCVQRPPSQNLPQGSAHHNEPQDQAMPNPTHKKKSSKPFRTELHTEGDRSHAQQKRLRTSMFGHSSGAHSDQSLLPPGHAASESQNVCSVGEAIGHPSLVAARRRLRFHIARVPCVEANPRRNISYLTTSTGT